MKNDSWWVPVIERWGMIDHQTALSCFLDRIEAQEKRLPQDLERARFSGLEYVNVWHFDGVVAAFVGWARSDSKLAWEHFIDLESRHHKLRLFTQLVRDHRSPISEMIATLAKDHPNFAFSEFQRAGLSKDLGLELRPYLLAGLAAGLPDETDWAGLFGRLENELRQDYYRVLRVAQGPLFGRWLEVDSRAAVAWLESEASGGIFRSAKKIWWQNGFEDYHVFGDAIPIDDPPILRAAICWLWSDSNGAFSWFQRNKSLVPRVLTELKEGSLDERERRILRRLLVFCFHRTERESLIREMMAGGGASLRLFADLDNFETLQQELAGLDLNSGFILEIIEALEASDSSGNTGGEFGDIRIEGDWE
jgi:hypothetical protein